MAWSERCSFQQDFCTKNQEFRKALESGAMQKLAMEKLESNWKTMWGKKPGTKPRQGKRMKTLQTLQKCVNFVDLIKSFQVFTCKSRLGYSRERAS